MSNERGLEAIIRIQELASSWDGVVVTPASGGLQLTAVKHAGYVNGKMAVEFFGDIGDFPMKDRLARLKSAKVFYAALPSMMVDGVWGEGERISFDAAPALYGFRRIGAHDVLGRTVEDIAFAGVMGEAVCMAGEAVLEAERGIAAEVKGDLDAAVFEEWFGRIAASQDEALRTFGQDFRSFFEAVSDGPEEDDDEEEEQDVEEDDEDDFSPEM